MPRGANSAWENSTNSPDSDGGRGFSWLDVPQNVLGLVVAASVDVGVCVGVAGAAVIYRHPGVPGTLARQPVDVDQLQVLGGDPEAEIDLRRAMDGLGMDDLIGPAVKR